MQANDITSERLRRLAGIRAGDAKVLSLFVNLDPREFATPAARRTEVRSLLDRAARRVRDEDGLSHTAQASLRSDLERLEAELRAGGLDAKGAHGLAIFTASALELFEVLKLPEPVEHGPVLADTPFIEPLSAIGTPDRWCVLLVNRRVARLFCGPGAALEEIEHVEDDVRGRHDQGGWSQPNYTLDRQGRRRPPAPRGPRRVRAAQARPARRAPGRGPARGGRHLRVPPAPVPARPPRRAAGHRRRARERRRRQARGRAAHRGGRARTRGRGGCAADRGPRRRAGARRQRPARGAGRAPRAARRDAAGGVRLRGAGVRCPTCGWLGAEETAACPADGSATEHADDIVEAAVERAVTQAADIRVLRDRAELASHGHIAAVLRF